MNIHKLYKHQYNTQNKQYKSYREQIMNTTPKENVKEKLEQIKDEQNRKFSLLYEHYKTNLEAVYQQQSLKLTGNQQLEQDQLNDDLDKQMQSLASSHAHRKHAQSEGFAREAHALECERSQRFADLDMKIKGESDEFEANSRARLARLRDEQRDYMERFDRECHDKFGVCLTAAVASSSLSSSSFSAASNRHSVVYNFDRGGGGDVSASTPQIPQMPPPPIPTANSANSASNPSVYLVSPNSNAATTSNATELRHHHSSPAPVSKTNRFVYLYSY